MAGQKAQAMMPTFNYEGVDRKGAKLKGELPARNCPQKLLCVNKGLPSK